MKQKIRLQLLSLVIVILALLPASSFSQAKLLKSAAKSSIAKTDVLPLDTAVKVGKLPNGFTYYIRKNVEPKNRVTMYLANKVGSILEDDDQQGLAHFMEHMSFNGTKNFPKNELVSYLQKAGVRFGSDLNAYTSFDETVYQLPIPTDDPVILKNGFQIMRDWAQDATLDSTEIEKERGVILEEKRLGKSAQQRLQDKYLPVLFNQSRYSNRLPIGTEAVLKNFTAATIRKFHSDWYRPDLQALIIVGDIDVKATEKTIKDLFSSLKSPAKPRPRIDYTIPLTQKNQFFAATDKEFPVMVVQAFIKHPETKLITTADYRQSILRSLYNRIIGARIGELSKQANPPFIQGGSSIGGFLADLDVASAVVVGKPGELEKGFKAVWTEVERAKKFGFTQTELDRAKESLMQNMESAYKERDKTNSENYVREYLNLFLKQEASPGIAYEYQFYKDNLGGITLDEVNRVVKKYLVDVNRDIIILGPDKEAANLPTETVVDGWVSDVQKSEIAAYVDNVSDKPLLEKKPVAGKVVAEKKLDGIGVVELTLNNGVKVNLKPTDFKNDEISFQAFSPGGSSLYSDADYESANRASSLINYSGVADYSSVQLTKYLTGKKVRVSPYISERTEGISGSATPKDLETALQLVYLYFTQPRKDVEVYKGLLSQEKASIANRSNDPPSVFSDTISAVLGNYSIRRTGPSIEKYDKINLDRAFEIYKDRFADASDFTFTFVGSFDVEKLKPLLEQYLGALPSTKRIEVARDLGIHIPSGKIQKQVYKGQEQKSTVRLTFSGVYQYNETENNLLDALSSILDIKLIERLREDESGVYGVGTRASYSKYPENRYSFSIAFGCSPDNVEKLISSALDEVKKIRDNGPLQVDVEKVQAEERRVTEVQLKENGFWLGYLSGQFQNDENPEQILTYQEDLKKITSEALKVAAIKYLSGDNFVRLVLYPDKQAVPAAK
ncbi:MAG TPA: insulinase family protein [Prolixibacteraceae bacterium]|nr:insulinase family protein [Prolixibacteraceae bacterium]